MRRCLALAVILGATFASAGCHGPIVTDDEEAPAMSAASEGVDPRNLKVPARTKPLKPRDPIPELVLPDQKGRDVSTIELTTGGDTLLIFHPGDASPVTRPVYPWVTGNRSMLGQHHCEILLVSPDPLDVNTRVAGEEELHVGILMDRSSWAARTFGLIPDREMKSLDRVWSVLLGRGGKVLLLQEGLPTPSDIVEAQLTRPTKDDESTFFDFVTE